MKLISSLWSIRTRSGMRLSIILDLGSWDLVHFLCNIGFPALLSLLLGHHRPVWS